MNIDRVKIETILAEKGMTRMELSGKCGLSQASISTVVRRGTCEPKTVGKIAKGLGVPVSDIIAREA